MSLAGDIHILGNILPPLKFEKDGRVQGVMVDVLSKMMEEVGQPIDQDVFQIMAWARAYEDAVTIPGSILLGVALTEERRSQLKWVGPIFPLQLALVGKKNKPFEIKHASDAARYNVGTLLNSAPEQLLFKQGFPRNKVHRIPKTELGLRMLEDGRLDLLAFAAISSFKLMADIGIEPKGYQVYYVIKDVDLYFGLNKGFEDDFVDKLNAAFIKLKQPDSSGISDYDRILQKYCIKYR